MEAGPHASLSAVETAPHFELNRSRLAPLRVLLVAHPLLANIALLVCVALVPLALLLLWAAWFRLLPELWQWGFSELSMRSIAAVFGVFALALFPIYLPVGAVAALGWVLEVLAHEAAAKVERAIEQGSERQASAEDELAAQDKSGLVLLLRYSRVQLEAYYAIGLTQTQRSFRYSIVAMWIGFAVIVAGIVIRVFDFSAFGLRPLDTDVTTLIIVSGAIIEVISALFLWVYRSSVKQLTYFYNRQLYNHSVLMSQRIAETMTNADEVKRTIVEKLLDRTWSVEPDALPSGKGLLSMKGG